MQSPDIPDTLDAVLWDAFVAGGASIAAITEGLTYDEAEGVVSALHKSATQLTPKQKRDPIIAKAYREASAFNLEL